MSKFELTSYEQKLLETARSEKEAYEIYQRAWRRYQNEPQDRMKWIGMPEQADNPNDYYQGEE